MKRQTTIVTDKEILKLGRVHKGFMFHRTKEAMGDRELAFYKHWKKANKNRTGINFGYGILQDLFVIPSKGKFRFFHPIDGFKVLINNRDRYIVATVIQWLGTNVGFAFLQQVLRDCGYTVQMTEEARKKFDKKMKRYYDKHLYSKVK